MEPKLQAAEKAEILERAEALEQVELLKQAEALGQAEVLGQAQALGQAELKLPKMDIFLHLREHIETIMFGIHGKMKKMILKFLQSEILLK